jgi:hypothetical protein
MAELAGFLLETWKDLLSIGTGHLSLQFLFSKKKLPEDLKPFVLLIRIYRSASPS